MRNAALWDHFIELAWTQARNALYHGGTVGPLVFLDTSDPDGIVGLIAHPVTGERIVTVNPAGFVRFLRLRFNVYVALLRDPANAVLREAFVTRFDDPAT